MNWKKPTAVATILAFMFSQGSEAAGLFSGVPPAGGTQYPQTLPLTGNETIPADTQLPQGANPQTELITVNQLAGALASPASGNLLVGGDATSNLFQRATSGASVTTTLTYGGPDEWAYWSGTGTAMTVSQDTTAGDLAPGFPASFKMARTAAQTGVVQMCMAQEIETNMVKSSGIAGSTAELTFNAFTGATFSAAAPFNMTAYIVTGTGTDQGLAGTSSMAFGLNGGGGGSGSWTGQANATAAVISLGGVSTLGRYAAVANIPAAATEIGVALCYTPTGTAGANDYIAFSGIQLRKAPEKAALASATVGYSCATGGIQCSNFERRPYPQEQALQFRYYYQINDNVANTVPITMCQATTTAAVVCVHQFPVAMRIAPTATASAATAFSDTATAGAPTACTAFAVVAASTSILTGKTTCTTGATVTAGGASQLTGAATGANVNFNASL